MHADVPMYMYIHRDTLIHPYTFIHTQREGYAPSRRTVHGKRSCFQSVIGLDRSARSTEGLERGVLIHSYERWRIDKGPVSVYLDSPLGKGECFSCAKHQCQSRASLPRIGIWTTSFNSTRILHLFISRDR